MSKRLYGIAVVGFGGMGSQHINLLRGMPEFFITGICDIDSQRKEIAGAQGLPVYVDFKTVVYDPNASIVLIATPNHLHKENRTELQEMIKAVELSQRIFVVHQNRRWDEDFLAIQKINDENIIGDIFHLESRVHGSRGIPVTCVRKRSTVAA